MSYDTTGRRIYSVPIADLKPAEYNPRYITEWDFDHIKHSLEKFGFVLPLIVNCHVERMMVIIGGHQRYLVAKKLGHKELPVIFRELDLAEEKRLNVRLNKLGGAFDYDKLINHYGKEDLMAYGFTATELDLIYQLNPEPQEPIAKTRTTSNVHAFSLHFKSLTQQQDFFNLITALKLKDMNTPVAEQLIKKMTT